MWIAWKTKWFNLKIRNFVIYFSGKEIWRQFKCWNCLWWFVIYQICAINFPCVNPCINLMAKLWYFSAEIEKHKGSVVLPQNERSRMVKAMRNVDEVGHDSSQFSYIQLCPNLFIPKLRDLQKKMPIPKLFIPLFSN